MQLPQLYRILRAARAVAGSTAGRSSGLGARSDVACAMDGLRAAIGHLSSQPDADAERVSITAAAAVFAAAWARVRTGRQPVRPDPTISHAADDLRMATGSSEHSGSLDVYLVTVAEHGMNASTFAARVVSSTGSDRSSRRRLVAQQDISMSSVRETVTALQWRRVIGG